jgi:very-long-chain (3R)-3-hydroxyacyl-CoA dehydratase
MDSQKATGTARKPGPKPLQSSSPKTQYLILYNFVSAVLWLAVLGRVVLLVPLVGFARVYPGAGNFAKWTQTLALLEVLHAAFGECLILQLRIVFYIQLANTNGSQAS